MSRLEELAVRASESHALQCSMVNFMAGLLVSYAGGSQTPAGFAAQFMRENRNAQFYFSHFPRTEIQRNQELFHREFVLADALRDVIEQQGSMEQAAFDEALAACLETYLSALTEDGDDAQN